jgi:ACS family hexuronate transporter-like MFS transporter
MKYIRWSILLLLFLASVLNYFDRQSLSILANTIQKDIQMTDMGYAHVIEVFLLAYMIGFLIVGWLTDRLGVRVGMILFIGLWSLSNMATGFVGSVRGLAIVRFFLGAGESGLYVAAPKIVGEVFPASQRGLAVGIYSAGATVGATVAPPVIALLTVVYGWRAAFVVGGIMGLVWIVPWLLVSRPRRSDEADALSLKPSAMRTPQPISTGWRDVLLCRPALLLLLVRMITDPVWQFLLYWFPKYLGDAHGMSLVEVGRIVWIVYLAADIGGIGAGWLAGVLVTRGLNPADACKWVMIGCTIVIPTCALVPFLSSPAAIMTLIGVISLSVFGYMISVAALAVEILPQDRFGSIWGLVCAGSGLGGIIFADVVGRLITSFSYRPVFMVMACLHPAALVLIWLAAKSRARGALASVNEIAEELATVEGEAV